jgi:hypothetical protein
MAGSSDSWIAEVRYLVKPGAGLVQLGRYAVPKEAEVKFSGDKTLAAGRRWPDAAFRFEVRDGAAECTEVRITSRPGDRAIRTNDLLVFNLDALAEEVFTALAMKPSGTGSWSRTSGKSMPEAQHDMHTAVEASYSDPLAELLDVANVYLSPYARAKPTESVMDALGYGSRSTASRKVKAARAAGLIPPPDATDEARHKALSHLSDQLTARQNEATESDWRHAARDAAAVDPEAAMRAKGEAWLRRNSRSEPNE